MHFNALNNSIKKTSIAATSVTKTAPNALVAYPSLVITASFQYGCTVYISNHNAAQTSSWVELHYLFILSCKQVQVAQNKLLCESLSLSHFRILCHLRTSINACSMLRQCDAVAFCVHSFLLLRLHSQNAVNRFSFFLFVVQNKLFRHERNVKHQTQCWNTT